MKAKEIFNRIREIPEAGVIAAFVIMCVILSFLSDVFFTLQNFVNILQQPRRI